MLRLASSQIALLCWLRGATALHVQPEAPNTYLEAGTEISPKPGLSLRAWPAAVARQGEQSITVPSMSRPSDQVPSSGAYVAQPVQAGSIFYAKGATKMRLIVGCMTFALVLAGFLLAPWKCWWGDSEHDSQRISADAHMDLVDLVERGDGSWIHTYRASNSEQKDGLELLLRCRIISAQEFLHGIVSQEHMDECVWIAVQMLRQKSLEEWVAYNQQALQSFEDSVTTVYAARTTAQFGKGSLHPKDHDDSAPLQAALNDLLILKGGFPSPLVHSKSIASRSASVSPATPPFRIPAAPFEQTQGVQHGSADINFTFAPQVPEGPRLSLPPSSAMGSGSRLHLSASAAPAAREGGAATAVG